MDRLFRDLRYAFRTLRRSPGFTIFAVVTIALGIGATSTIFSVIDAVLLSPLPYRAPDRLVALWEHGIKDGNVAFPISVASFADWREQNQVFTKIAASRNRTFTITEDGGTAEQLFGANVTDGYFDILGVQPQLGRLFRPEEDVAGGPRVVLLGDGLWRRRFGADREVVGKVIQLASESYEVVGVLPPSARMPRPNTEYWTPMQWSAAELADRGNHYLAAIGRLKPGVSIGQARASMSELGRRLEQEHPDVQAGFNVTVRSLTEDVVGDVRTPLYVVAGAVGFLLLICCANVANLLLARVASRHKEIAIRSAVGAGRGHIVRQLMAESIVLALVGGGLGIVLAAWGTHGLAVLGAAELPRLDGMGVDARVVGFAVAVTLGTGLLFGLAPALQASRTDLNQTLKDGTRGSSGGPGAARARQLLLVAEVAISLTLLVGAGLMIRSLDRLRAVDTGFRTDHLLTAQIPLPRVKYDSTPERVAFYAALQERLGALPDVRGVTMASGLPYGGNGVAQIGYFIEGRTPRHDNAKVPVAYFHTVTADYFTVLGIPLRRGRVFAPADRADAPPVAIVNETLARQEFAGENPVGKRFQTGDEDSPFITIVGVVGDVRQRGVGEDAPPVLYTVNEQIELGSLTVFVRARGNPDALVSSVRREVQALDPDVPLARLATMDALLADSMARPRFLTVLLTIFAGVALVLALIGIYGVVAYSVAQRTQEFGIRMALGADAGRVLGDVVRQAATVTGIGIGIGLVSALLLSRLIATLLFQTGTADPVTYGVIIALLLGVTIVASWVPARRATRVSPLAALRSS